MLYKPAGESHTYLPWLYPQGGVQPVVFVRLHLLRGRWGQRYSRHIRYHSRLRGHQPRPEHYPRRKPNNRKHPLFAPTATLAARLRWDSPRAPHQRRTILPSRQRTTVTMSIRRHTHRESRSSSLSQSPGISTLLSTACRCSGALARRIGLPP